VSDWFFMLGEPLADSEQDQARDYLRGLGLPDDASIEGVANFDAAARIISHPDWDHRWWDAEQRERERLLALASAALGRAKLLDALSRASGAAVEATHGAAAVQAARLGCSDAGLIRAAAGALGEALYLAKLAELADQAPSHPFLLKRALFGGGHWPLGIVGARFYIF